MDEKMSSNGNYESQPFDEILDKLPEQKREAFQLSLILMQLIQKTPEQDISEKITSDHISAYLKSSSENMRLTHKGQSQNRILIFMVSMLVAALFAIIVFVFKDSPDVVEKILFTVGGAIVGAIGGFGYGKSKQD